jgi:hypothetical protein
MALQFENASPMAKTFKALNPETITPSLPLDKWARKKSLNTS